MISSYALEYKPLYTPFDYSFPPCREYIPLQEIECFEPRPYKAITIYREVVSLQDSSASEIIEFLNEDGKDAVIRCLTDYYDYGNGTKHKIQPWGENDKVFENGQYVLVVNLYLPCVSLYSVE